MDAFYLNKNGIDILSVASPCGKKWMEKMSKPILAAIRGNPSNPPAGPCQTLQNMTWRAFLNVLKGMQRH
jgi:hypothetical protein